MGKTKTQVEPSAAAKAAPDVTPEKQQATPEPQKGAIALQKQAAAATPPPNGTPPASRVASVVNQPAESTQAPVRAQMSTALQRNVGNTRMLQMIGGVQTKIAVGAPGDRYEQEADDVAGRIVSGQKVVNISRIALAGQALPVERQEEEEEQRLQGSTLQRQTLKDEEKEASSTQLPEHKKEKAMAVQAKLGPSGTGMVEDGAVEARIKSPGGGRPLEDGVRTEMESGLGANFSNVRVHDSSSDQGDAKSLGAKAFTYQNHIWLGPGASSGDRKLMAHELTHVVQQGGGVRRKADDADSSRPMNGYAAGGAKENSTSPSPEPPTTPTTPASESLEMGTFESHGGDRQGEFAGFDQAEMPVIAEDSAALANEPPLLLNTDAASIGALAADTTLSATSGPVAESSLSVSAPGGAAMQTPGLSSVEMPSVGEDAGSAAQSEAVTGVIQREDDDGGLLGGIRSRINSVVEGLSSGWQSMSNMAQGAVDGIRSQVGAMADGLTGLVSSAVSGLQGAWSGIGQTATQLTEAISNQVRTAMESVTGIVSAVGDAIISMDGNALRAAWGRVTGFISSIRQALQQSVQRVFQRIVGLWQALRERFNGILRRLATGVRAAFSRLQSVVQGLSRRLQSAWDALQSRATQLSGILGGILDRLRSLVSRLLSWGQRIWDGIRSGWNALRDRVSGFVDQVRERFSGLWQSLRERAMSLWASLGAQWQRLQQWLRNQVSGFLGRVQTVWNELTDFDIGSVIDAIIRYAPFLSAVREVAQNPDSVMRPMAESIATTIDAGMPAAAEQQARQNVGEGGGERSAPAGEEGGGVAIQRTVDDVAIQRVELRQPLDNSTIWSGFLEVLRGTWNEFTGSLLSNVLTALYEMIAIWETIPRDLQGLWDDLAQVVDRMQTEGMGFWRHLIDIPLIIWRRVNAILLHLFPWFVLISALLGGLAGAGLLGAAGGAIIGFFSGGTLAAPGAAGGATVGFAGGAGLGLGFALGVGEGLLASYIAGEVASLLKAWGDLGLVEQTEEEQVEDLSQMVTSAVGGGIAAVLWAATAAIASAFGAQISRALVRIFRIRPGSGAARFIEGISVGFRRGSPFRKGATSETIAEEAPSLTRGVHKWRGPNIKSGVRQQGLRDSGQIDQMKRDMLNGDYRFTEPDGRIGGWRDDAGNYYIGEGHHRMNAALEIFEETGNATYANQLLEHGSWTPGSPPPSQVGPLPRR